MPVSFPDPAASQSANSSTIERAESAFTILRRQHKVEVVAVKGRSIDSIFIARSGRPAWETGSQAGTGIGRQITFCNHHRQKAAQGGQPPAVDCFNAIQTGQQVQAVAQITRKPVRQLGRSSLRLGQDVHVRAGLPDAPVEQLTAAA